MTGLTLGVGLVGSTLLALRRVRGHQHCSSFLNHVIYASKGHHSLSSVRWNDEIAPGCLRRGLGQATVASAGLITARQRCNVHGRRRPDRNAKLHARPRDHDLFNLPTDIQTEHRLDFLLIVRNHCALPRANSRKRCWATNSPLEGQIPDQPTHSLLSPSLPIFLFDPVLPPRLLPAI
ncbi:hypothetical protein VTI74DRAFT_2704 [Chaetomium olivicolor]